jgi:uncharacterized protein (TIGR00730 family)
MLNMKSVAVFCGSSTGSEKIYMEQAFLLGETLAKRNVGLIYGGAKVGLMGSVADGALRQGGKVLGVLPRFLQNKEIAHENLTELIIVNTMHERKTKMSALCEGVIALPGGFGTLEELFEILTWAQLGLHQKPIAILNINGFYNDLLSCLQTMVDKGFLKAVNQSMLLVSNSIGDILHQMVDYQPVPVGKWIKSDET